jgi:hypothetical protein
VHEARALARPVIDQQNIDGWDTTRIEPPLAGLVKIETWLYQWRHDYDAAHGRSPAEFYQAFLDDQHPEGFRSRRCRRASRAARPRH